MATFLREGKVIQKEVDVDEALDVPVITEALMRWRRDYNKFRPDSSLGDLTPHGFAEQSRRKVA
jgi:hypothetical protein